MVTARQLHKQSTNTKINKCIFKCDCEHLECVCNVVNANDVLKKLALRKILLIYFYSVIVKLCDKGPKVLVSDFDNSFRIKKIF